MVPIPFSNKDTSNSRLARPRRRSLAVIQWNAGSLQKTVSDSFAVPQHPDCVRSVLGTTDGGQGTCVSGDVARSSDILFEECRIDPAHFPPPNRRPRSSSTSSNQSGTSSAFDSSRAPRQSPSFGSLLPDGAVLAREEASLGTSQRQCEVVAEKSKAADVGRSQGEALLMAAAPVDVGSNGRAQGSTASLKNESSCRQQVDDVSRIQSGDLDGQSTKNQVGSFPESGVVAEDLLVLHADDLIRRLQSWSADLSSRESQLAARISLQEQRERRFRASCDASVAKNS